MCGFIGVLGNCRTAELERMAKPLDKRGPDDSGSVHCGDFHGLHKRLAIIGPDASGHQPMRLQQLHLLFNGCIYNYPELRLELEQLGHRFHTQTDSEVLLHMYQQYGQAMLPQLQGMYAFAIWDAQQQSLFLARDPFGEKPLYISQQQGRSVFGSSLRCFERSDLSLSPNTRALHPLLCRMRIQAPETMYQEVWQLPAGCYASIKGKETAKVSRFYHLPTTTHEPPASIEELGQTLDRAFAKRMLSDRPLGVFLSGGIDSALIAESLARQSTQTVQSFSVRFSDASADFDESSHAAEIAHAIGAEHHILDVTANASEVLESLANAFDQPVSNSSALPTWLICQAAKKHVDVALSGVGGDELFGGYPRYLGMRWHQRLRRLPARHSLLKILQKMGDSQSQRNLRGRLRRFLQGLDMDTATAYQHWISVGHQSWSQMFQIEASQPVQHPCHDALTDHGQLRGLQAQYGVECGSMMHDVLSYLPDDLLLLGDRMSMDHSLELRAPFLDTDLLHCALRLPSSQRLAGPPWKEGLKIALKSLAQQRLPASVSQRPKQGFMAPIKHWLRHELSDRVEHMVQQQALGAAIRPEFMQRIWQQHQQGHDHSDMLWGLLLLDTWMQQRQWNLQ